LIRIFNNDITTNFVLAKGKSSKRKYRFLPVGSLCCFCKSYYSLPKGIRIFFNNCLVKHRREIWRPYWHLRR